ncbi:hypothetical protein KFU94_19125 [Chloroflexi bacterium TSY]|nr:hypothetical protein [Chloroflexi bacterium TSY]
MMDALESCPDCRAELPPVDGPTHRYIGASAACWAIFSALNNAGEPPLSPASTNQLLVDAYAAQHPGRPSPQAIQSVAVHLLVLYGVFEKGIDPANALWMRRHALQGDPSSKQERFSWLAPPDFSGSLTIVDIIHLPTPEARTELVKQYVEGVWGLWSDSHRLTIVEWYNKWLAGGTP